MKQLFVIASLFGLTAGPAFAGANYFFSDPQTSVGDLAGTMRNGGPYESNIGPSATPPNDLQSAGVSDVAGSSATASVAEAPVLLKATATAGTGSGYYMQTARASSELEWTIDVIGGSAPVTFEALLKTSGTNISDGISGYESTAELDVNFSTILGSACASSIPGACATGELANVDLKQTVTLSAGLHTVTETVSTFANDQGISSASADPSIFIDPTFLADHPGYSLTTPPGLGGPAAAPEPAAWTLMLGGLGLTGVALRRRRLFRREVSVS